MKSYFASHVVKFIFFNAAFFASAGTVLSDPIFVDQGAWKASDRKEFYTQDQGSRMMPFAWLKAAKQADGTPFLADSLKRYGYLPNPDNTNNLPIGFTSSGPQGLEIAGMTCSACHTRQISVKGQDYRIDGGPAIVDFQAFLSDLDSAIGKVLNDPQAFQAFAEEVLGSKDPTPADLARLRQDVEAWYLRYDTLIKGALPKAAWGPARLDAVGMIFDRLTGLDLGKPPSYLIADNIKPADAPVRYPVLWNAPKQDKTQWPGFADNGNDILGLSRNLGEVYGVFGVFEPKKEWWHLLGVNYLNNNSADFDGLNKLEGLVKQIGAPKWPWPVNTALADQGKSIYNRTTAQGGCTDCHGIRPGEVRFFKVQTWATTPLQDVGTDTKEYDILNWTAQTGVLEGAKIPFITPALKPTDKAFNILATSVLGSIIQNYVPLAATAEATQAKELEKFQLSPSLQDLKGAFHPEAITPHPETKSTTGAPTAQSAPQYVYEARVLEGIWAAAPYLHNGSVPTLNDLLKPVGERVHSFKIGSNYDIENVGLATEQTQFNYTLNTTDCSQRNSGDSRCGHEFGTGLSSDEKKALLEYLKTL